MRIQKLILLVLIAIAFSCSDKSFPNPLLGTWKYNTESYTSCTDPVDNGNYDYTCDASNCLKISFNQNNTFLYEALVNGTLSTSEGSYTIEDSKLIMCITSCDDPIDYKIENGMLHLILQDDAGCTVTKMLVKV